MPWWPITFTVISYLHRKPAHSQVHLSFCLNQIFICARTMFPCAGYDAHVQIWVCDTHQPTRAVQAGLGKHALHQKYRSDTV